MSKFPRKTMIAAAAILAATAYGFAQMSPGGPMGMHGQMHGEMNGELNGKSESMNRSMAEMHRQMMREEGVGMHGGMRRSMEGGVNGMSGGALGMDGPRSEARDMPVIPGQDAFGAIQEVVQILQADPATDWAKVNIGALRQHLIDMNEVTLRADSAERTIDNGIEIAVTGEGRTLEAIRRMVPAHVSALREIGWDAKSEELPNGVRLTVTANEAHPLTMLKALGFMGIMAQGGHHQPHHLMMAKGRFPMP